jgi:hypothetical protein
VGVVYLWGEVEEVVEYRFLLYSAHGLQLNVLLVEEVQVER